jgi:3-hydroxyisobutyrate dehydrogenase-like beta-hydroxyacid dehydrogenase
VGHLGAGAVSGAAGLRVGFAGLGRMGALMARNLARAGLLAAVYNRTGAVADELARDVGAESCATPAALAARSNVLITMLADEHASTELYGGADGFLAALLPGTVAVEMGTVSVGHVGRLAQLVGEHGGVLLDAPVSGSVAMAEAGTLTLLVGGPEAAADRIAPVLEALGSTVLHLGATGTGAAMKLAVNTVVYGLNEALSEGLVLAERSGISRGRAYAALVSSAAAAPFVRYRRAAFERPAETPVAFRLALAEKDLELILGLARDVGAELPQARLNAEVLRRADAAGFAEADVSAVAEYLRAAGREAGMGQ